MKEIMLNYNLYESAIRYWDGYWFGKSRILCSYANAQDWGLYFYLRLQYIMNSNGFFIFCIRGGGKVEKTTLY